MLSDVCDRIVDADVDVVTQAMGLDSRIGQKYLKGATAYGGPCFPRDNIAFTALAENLGAKANLAKATDEINDYQVERITSLLEPWDRTKKIAVLGLAYKPHTYVVEESMGVLLANDLAHHGYAVSVYDPKALSAAEALLNKNIYQYTSLTDCIAHADILIIATDWPEFRATLTPELLKRPAHPRVIIDCWRTLPQDSISPVAELLYLGQGNKSFSNSLSEKKYA
jgi:UDPglucose 6-dehydrogenase